MYLASFCGFSFFLCMPVYSFISPDGTGERAIVFCKVSMILVLKDNLLIYCCSQENIDFLFLNFLRQLTTAADGVPLFEIFLRVNKKGEYKQQVLFLSLPSPSCSLRPPIPLSPSISSTFGNAQIAARFTSSNQRQKIYHESPPLGRQATSIQPREVASSSVVCVGLV